MTAQSPLSLTPYFARLKTWRATCAAVCGIFLYDRLRGAMALVAVLLCGLAASPVGRAQDSEAEVFDAAFASALAVDGNAADWANLSSGVVTMDTQGRGANGTLVVDIRYAWDDTNMYILVQENSDGDVSSNAQEGTDGDAFLESFFLFDCIAFWIDLDNSAGTEIDGEIVVENNADFQPWFGFSSSGRTDLIYGRANDSGNLNVDGLENGKVATGGTFAAHNRTIEVAIAWADIAATVDPDRQPGGDLEDAIAPGYIFGSEPLLLNNDFNGQAFIGPDQFAPPSGTDSDSRDIRLVPGLAAQDEFLVGQWTFEPGEELVDKTGNWGEIQLMGATVADGHLDLSPGQFALAEGYTGPTIAEKTLVAWLRLESLDVNSGGPLAIANPNVDRFDAIVYAERQAKRWMPGSTGFRRTEDVMDFDESVLKPELLQIAITYADADENDSPEVTLYRNGEETGGFEKGPLVEWAAGEAQALFGPRAFNNQNPSGAIDALVEEARIYNTALTEEQIQGLSLGSALPDPVGQWTFEGGGGEELTDLAGNWGEIELKGAEVVDGQLDLGPGKFALAEGYTGPTIREKTLVAWLRLESLDINSGGPLAIDHPTQDRFDSITYAERQAKRWMPGSTGFRRTEDVMDFDESVLNPELLQIAISYADADENDSPEVTLYRNGEMLGSFEKGPLVEWPAGEAQALFGPRAFNNMNPSGAIDALVEEARIYDFALSADEIKALFDEGPVVPDVTDSDGDGLLDTWENKHFGNLDQTADGDPDGDGLNNLGEQEVETDPDKADSDDDGLSDGAEIAAGTDPLNPDSDDDGLNDGAEIASATDPLNPDSDGDRANDGDEVAGGSDPNDAQDTPGAERLLLHQWTFNDDLSDAIGPADGIELLGTATLVDGRLKLNGGSDGVQTEPIGQEIKAKTLVAWVTLNDVEPGGGWGAIAIQAPIVDKFDAIAYGERTAKQWMAGSTGFQRTVEDNGGVLETLEEPDKIMMAITYDDDENSSITIYRNGEVYADADAASKGTLQTYDPFDFVFFGRRVFRAPPNMNGFIDEARIYGAALSAGQISNLFERGPVPQIKVKPRHQWTFNQDLSDSVGEAHGSKLDGNAHIVDGRLVLGGGSDGLQTEPIGETLEAKTLMAWVTLNDVNPGGGWGAIAVQAGDPVDKFDAIAYGERTARQWMAGSTGFRRTVADNEGELETLTEPDEIMMAITYDDDEDSSITIYRNGEIYADADAATVGTLVTYDPEDFVYFGRRVFRAPPNMNGFVNEGRIYDTALSHDDIRAIYAVGPVPINESDRDGDGLSDDWENEHFGNLDQTADGDPDGDGLNNLGEQEAQTDPNKADSDDDGVRDGAETNTGTFVDSNDTGTDPLAADTDGDTLKDGVETGTGIFVSAEDPGTDPNRADTDGDLFTDDAEIAGGTNPNDPNSPRPPDPEEFLVGQWTFERGEELIDTTGNWGEIELMGATVADGNLDLGPGQFALAQDYTGPTIREKTLVAWLRLESLDVNSGGPLAIAHPGQDRFDAIVYAERQPKRWMPGSTGFRRTEDIMTFDESVLTPELLQIAISYADTDGDDSPEVTLLRNGEVMGSYEKGPLVEWEGDGESAQALFGPRAFNNQNPSGSIDALVEEARIYNVALTQVQIRNLSLTPSGPFQIVEVSHDAVANAMTITWTSRPGKTYTIESAQDLEIWTELTDGFPAEEGETTTLIVDEIPPETLELYLRVQEE